MTLSSILPSSPASCLGPLRGTWARKPRAERIFAKGIGHLVPSLSGSRFASASALALVLLDSTAVHFCGLE